MELLLSVLCRFEISCKQNVVPPISQYSVPVTFALVLLCCGLTFSREVIFMELPISLLW